MNVIFDKNRLRFVWDSGNKEKIESTHGIKIEEVEEALQNVPLLLKHDQAHSNTEIRYHLLGVTNEGRGLFVVITYRDDYVRVISARLMSKRERLIFKEISQDGKRV